MSPGAAVGQLAFDADTAERWAKEKKAVVMIRAETKPDDVHGMLAARGILTSRGGRTSHAALVARQFGKPAVVGVMALEVDAEKKEATIKRSSVVLREGDWVSIDGTTGEVFLGQVETMQPSLEDPALIELLGWADGSAAWACGPTPTTRGMPSARGRSEPRASACAAPSTCSSRPSGCRWCRR